ncbi:MAG: carbonic anhydrase [Gammaproteobacteria bacterium]|nr:carbonic anhydrase [Gammaproteobacteria bacterium]MDD9896527.1 carbonic anhydrase [Gammaproteobacteria bacterium]MDD9958718.1 carbonic anhydrase [Gammaproteobacteria bacterium]
MLDAETALLRLKQGNKEFRSGETPIEVDEERRLKLVEQQQPFAIILGCSDSRVPVELIFAQGLGELFVIRVAGNVATPTQIGSIEFAARNFGSKLVVVLGHSSCGAIKATIRELENPGQDLTPNLQVIVDSIKPGISSCITAEDPLETKIEKAVRANVQSTIKRITNESEILQQKVAKEGLKIVGAEYSLESGIVNFF